MKYPPFNRKCLSEKVRKQVHKKNYGLCFYCGCLPKKIYVDHFKPTSIGGSDRLCNLFPSCHRCNILKSDLSLEDFRERYVRMEILKYPRFTIEQKDWLINRGINIDNEIKIAMKEFRFSFEKEAK